MDVVLGGLEAFAAPYIDDTIIFSNDCEQHFGHIQEVIGCFQQAGLIAKPAKCQWAKRTLEYLGHVVRNDLVLVPEAKVEALWNYTRPKTKAQLKSILGLTGYYRHFILNYSKPLNAKTKAEAPLAVDWDEVSASHFSYYVLFYVLRVPSIFPPQVISLYSRQMPPTRGSAVARA